MSWKATASISAAAFLIFAAVDVLAFRTGLYRAVLDPFSSTGSFEAAVAQFRELPAYPKRDVLVLGDSRIYSGLDPAAAAAAGHNLRFLNGGVPGTTPRCWPFFLRAIDPDLARFRAVVIAVDTYADDDTAIGSLDGDDRPMDLRYVVFQTRLSDLPKLAGSFSDPRERVENGIDLFWRGQELRDDVQALAADPLARLSAIRAARSAPAYDPLGAHPRSETLAGLQVNFATNTITYPSGIPDDQRSAIATQVLTLAKPSPSYARYRLQWLAPIAAQYEAAGIPVIFVRIPTRPAHRSADQLPSGSLVQIAREYGAHLIPAAPYIALERPALFADEDHLNREGSRRFSALLGSDVSVILSGASGAPNSVILSGATSASASVILSGATSGSGVEGRNAHHAERAQRVEAPNSVILSGASGAPTSVILSGATSGSGVEGRNAHHAERAQRVEAPNSVILSEAPNSVILSGATSGSGVEGRNAHHAERAQRVEAESPAPQPHERHSLSWFAAACGIGIPLQFASYEFWLFFLIVALLFYLLPRRAGWWVLLIASYYFYARWNAWYVVFLWILTASDFAIGLWVERARESGRRDTRLLLAAGIAANLAFLGTFKYLNFASTTVAALVGMHQNPWLVSLFVPIGISFHTFQSISYLVDVYRGRTPAIRKPFDYALYLAFFPQLLAGPIVRAGLFFGEFLTWRVPDPGDITYGLARAGFGLLKKTAVADQFAAVANGYFESVAAHPGAPAAWSALFAFSMQIYFDFSGYSDIAIGCARLLGFVFPENFNMPYLATSITNFWHRWHITLSTWLRDYLYIPLGGSRYGMLATLRNLMITMLLGGLWHGAQWTFVAWGGFHGALLCIERVLGIGRERTDPQRSRRALRGLVATPRIVLTFALVTLGWVLFRAPSFSVALTVYRELFAGGAGAGLLTGWTAVLSIIIVAYGGVRVLLDRWSIALDWFGLQPALQAATLAALLLALQLFSWTGPSPAFIYFKF